MKWRQISQVIPHLLKNGVAWIDDFQDEFLSIVEFDLHTLSPLFINEPSIRLPAFRPSIVLCRFHIHSLCPSISYRRNRACHVKSRRCMLDECVFLLFTRSHSASEASRRSLVPTGRTSTAQADRPGSNRAMFPEAPTGRTNALANG